MIKHFSYLCLLLSFSFFGCTVTKKVKDGETAYALKQYSVAVDLLSKELEDTKSKADKARKAYYLARSYDVLLQYDKAIKWFEQADRYNFPSAPEWLAKAYKKNEQYIDAAERYMKLYRDTKQSKYLEEAELCKRAIKQKAKLKNFNVNSFSINTKFGEYSPVYLDDEHLVFSSDRAGSQGGDTYKWTGNNFSDLYVANIKGRKVNNFDAIINTEANEGTACFSADGNQIFFTRCESLELRDQHCRIYFSHRPNGFWMEAEPLMFFDEQTNFAHPCLIENDSVLVFCAAPAGGDGTYDLYYSQRVEEGWSAPELMPESINTIGNEKFPSSYKDTLFFSSDHLPGFGGYDIFYTVLQSDGRWTRPLNMGLPINSGADDLGLAIDPKFPKNRGIELQGYFSSSRNVGTSDDLFFFTKYISKEEESTDPNTEEPEEKIFNTYLALRVVENQYEDGDPNKKIIGKKAISGAQINIRSARPDTSARSDKNGRYTAQVLADDNLDILVNHSGYMSEQLELSTWLDYTLANDTTINVEVALDKILYDKEIVLQSIYYDYNRWEIRKDAKPSLDTLKKILDLNADLKIQLSSHTDCRGELDYNLTLSQKRAESAVNYLLEAGVDPSRMIAKGYGMNSPIADCPCDSCSESEHQQNRRTTFKILKP